MQQINRSGGGVQFNAEHQSNVGHVHGTRITDLSTPSDRQNSTSSHLRIIGYLPLPTRNSSSHLDGLFAVSHTSFKASLTLQLWLGDHLRLATSVFTQVNDSDGGSQYNAHRQTNENHVHVAGTLIDVQHRTHAQTAHVQSTETQYNARHSYNEDYNTHPGAPSSQIMSRHPSSGTTQQPGPP